MKVSGPWNPRCDVRRSDKGDNFSYIKSGIDIKSGIGNDAGGQLQGFVLGGFQERLHDHVVHRVPQGAHQLHVLHVLGGGDVKLVFRLVRGSKVATTSSWSNSGAVLEPISYPLHMDRSIFTSPVALARSGSLPADACEDVDVASVALDDGGQRDDLLEVAVHPQGPEGDLGVTRGAPPPGRDLVQLDVGQGDKAEPTISPLSPTYYPVLTTTEVGGQRDGELHACMHALVSEGRQCRPPTAGFFVEYS
jgi:hypothetical protein